MRVSDQLLWETMTLVRRRTNWLNIGEYMEKYIGEYMEEYIGEYIEEYIGKYIYIYIGNI